MNNINVVKKWNYGNYSSNNYGVHSLAFTDINNNTYYFSYDTLVAFTGNDGLVIRKNVWGTTTGKHLNWISSDKSIRVDEETFNKKLEAINE
tara:strand:+ start:895 stop:1170 length:276 start_codon:yes stop_codon:yes gene_type:complete